MTDADVSAAAASLRDEDGHVLCTTMRNLIFVDHAQRWHTPDLTRAGVIGATRERLRAAVPDSVEAPVHTTRLADFGAVIACNSVGGAVAVTHIGPHEFAGSRALATYANALLATSA